MLIAIAQAGSPKTRSTRVDMKVVLLPSRKLYTFPIFRAAKRLPTQAQKARKAKAMGRYK